MTTKDILAARRACNETSGDAFLSDPEAQRNLRFGWNGSVVSDSCKAVDLEYFYPSAIGSNLFLHGSFEAGEIAITSALIEQIEDPVVLDIGANIGLHTVRWCLAVPRARVYAFEPIPANLALLARNVERHGLAERAHVEAIALDRACGTATIFESSDGAYSSFQERNARSVAATHEVATTTIDDFVAQQAIARVDLIKVDVGGHESAVLEGADRTLRRDAPSLFVEISATHANYDPGATIERILALGYAAYVINNGIVTTYEHHDDATYNYLFIHPRHALGKPTTNAEAARGEFLFLAYLQARSEALPGPLSQTASERLRLIMQTAANALPSAGGAIAAGRALELLQALRNQVEAITASAEAEIRDATDGTMAGDILAKALAERDRVRSLLQREADARAVLLEAATHAADERLAALNATTAEIATLRSHLDNMTLVAEERLELVVSNAQAATALREALDALAAKQPEAGIKSIVRRLIARQDRP